MRGGSGARASWVVERMMICVNCGVPVLYQEDGVHLFMHSDGYRTCAWIGADGTQTYAAPTDWVDAWEAVGFAPMEPWKLAWVEWATGDGAGGRVV